MAGKRGSFQPARLDVDPSIIDSKLQILETGDSEMDSLLKQIAPVSGPPKIETLLPEASYPSIRVKPEPGLCVKTRTVQGKKFFINLCKLREIPPPPPISEEELQRVIAEEDYTTLWRVPMSIGAPRPEKDKAGSECLAAEVAVNWAWFQQTMEPSIVFTSFVITVAIEGLGDKYEEARLDRDGWTILKNKKFLGDHCPEHCIQQRASAGIKEVEGGQQLSSKQLPQRQQKQIATSGIQSTKAATPSEIVPKYRIVKDRAEDPRVLTASIQLPGLARGSRDLTLDVGEDRLVVEARKANYLLDIFLPHAISQEEVSASFDTPTATLHVHLPLQA